jgi:hypothetical protein
MIKCPKCNGTEIVKGKITRSSDEFFSDIIFRPNGLRFLTITLKYGTPLRPESYGCLGCGAIWSQTDPKALKDFISKHCRKE